ncbi:MAG: sulfotransferase domain-containing protein [Cyanobacteria bacterium SBLK]|nr:sulfotransferase domain-containing protein [Cyanobacteria bacterium SBLK]
MKSKQKILINSLPKSGTHLLAKAIEIFGYEEHFSDRPNIEDDSESITPIFFNRRESLKALKRENLAPHPDTGISIGALTPLFVEPSVVQRWLDAMKPGSYILGHIPYTLLLNPILEESGFHHVFIIRDPRSVVASSIPFFLDTGKMPARHFLEEDIKALSPSDRVKFVLEGGYAERAGVPIKSFAEVYRSMLAWRDRPGLLFLHFEDLVGEGGGGSHEKQMQAIERIAKYLDVPFDEGIIAKAQEIYNPNARTFRKGKIDSWKTSLDAELVQRLIKYCEPLCIEAGYPIH